MTDQLALQQLEKLRRERAQAGATIEEYQARLPVLDAQIAALEPLAFAPAAFPAPGESPVPAVRVVTQPGKPKA